MDFHKKINSVSWEIPTFTRPVKADLSWALQAMNRPKEVMDSGPLGGE